VVKFIGNGFPSI